MLLAREIPKYEIDSLTFSSSRVPSDDLHKGSYLGGRQKLGCSVARDEGTIVL